MATIEKRTGARGTKYRVRVRIDGQQRTATFTRRTDAREWARETETALSRGRHVPTTTERRKTLGDAIDRYIKAIPLKARNRSSANTVQQLGWWKDRAGNTPLPQVTPALLTELRDELARQEIDTGQTRSPASVNRYLAALSHCLTTAAREWQWIERNPMRNVSRLEEPKGRVRFLSDDERTALLEACRNSPDPDLYLIVLLALSTGARKGELLGLTWADVDVQRQRITLEDTKNRDRRVLPLAGPALEAVKARSRTGRRLDTPLVFPGRVRARKDGTRPEPGPKSIEKVWRAALAEAGIENFRFHDLRHSAASYLAMNGATLAELAEILGHRTLAMVRRYAHFSDQHTASVVERMNTAVFGGDNG